MLLELETSEVLHLMESPEAIKVMVNEAVTLIVVDQLDRHRAQDASPTLAATMPADDHETPEETPEAVGERALVDSTADQHTLPHDPDVVTITKALIKRNAGRWARSKEWLTKNIEEMKSDDEAGRGNDEKKWLAVKTSGRSGHIKLKRVCNGVTQKLCLASTPSDVRHRKNDAARFKRADEALMHGTFGFF